MLATTAHLICVLHPRNSYTSGNATRRRPLSPRQHTLRPAPWGTTTVIDPRSNARHGLVVDDIRFRVQRGVHAMLVDHVPPPVVLPGETLAAGSGIGAPWLEAVELAGLLMFVVDVTVEVRLGTESLVAVTMGALMRPIMIPPVMTVAKISKRNIKGPRIAACAYFNLCI